MELRSHSARGALADPDSDPDLRNKAPRKTWHSPLLTRCDVMDHGHYNCRDYYVSPHFAPTTVSKLINNRSPLLFRHESFDELEQRSRSPRSQLKFPLLKLPAEIRTQIYSYLLPRTIEHREPNPLLGHVRNFSAVKKRVAKGMLVPQHDPSSRQGGPGPVVWRRGNISLLSVNKQVHHEAAELLYGNSTFQLFVTYSGISFRYTWLLHGGGTPNRRYDFLELLPKKYLVLIKKVIVHVDHVDSYTGMIKFNVSGKGLTYGLRKQIQRLVNALQEDCAGADPDESIDATTRRMGKVHIRVSNGNAVLDQIKSDAVRQREGGIKVAEDLEEMLEPFGDLRGVHHVAIYGAVTETFAANLRKKMMSMEKADPTERLARGIRDFDLPPGMNQDPRLCVYGNDI